MGDARKARTRDGLDKLKAYRGALRKSYDRSCLIQCGQCCAESDFDPVRKTMTLSTKRGDRTGPPCMHLGPTGCTLDRRNRPKDCTGFVCRLSQLVTDGMIPLSRAKRMAREELPWRIDPDDLFKARYARFRKKEVNLSAKVAELKEDHVEGNPPPDQEVGAERRRDVHERRSGPAATHPQ